MSHPPTQLIRLRNVAPTPWRNGGGRTRELIAWPDLKDWKLRFSVADIQHDGPFSAYPGVLRDFCVLDGAGVLLHWNDGRSQRLVQGSVPLRFDGGDAPHAQLIDGATRDLNLMLREGMDAHLVANDARIQNRPWGCFVAEAGHMVIDKEHLALPEDTFVWFENSVTCASFDARGWWIARGEETTP